MQEGLKTVFSSGDWTVFLAGEIDHHSAEEIRNAIDSALPLQNPKRLILDFSGVSFMDSSAIGLILGRYRKMQEKGGGVAVCGLSERQEKMVKMAGIWKMITILKKEAKEDEEDEKEIDQ